MISVTLLPAYNLGNGVGGFIVGTVGGDVVPGSGNDNILRDGSDDSYVEIVGNPATQEQSQGVACIQPSTEDLGTTLAAVMPSNVTEIEVTFNARVQNAPVCAGTDPFVEVWGETTGSQMFYQNVALTSDFTDVSVPLPVVPDEGPWDLHFFIGQVLFFGFRARTACSISGEMGCRWSEASLTIEFELPTPVVSVLPAEDITPRSVTLLGTVNPNQVQGDLNFPVIYPLEWGFAVSAKVSDLAVEYEGTVGGTTNDIGVITTRDNLTPGTRYFYQLGARVDGVVTLSAIGTFTTPFTDPLKGVY